MERAGLITGSWSVVGGRRRRTYELTDDGRVALSGERVGWQEFAGAVTAALGTRPWPATS
ncbi:PadR family transcriptional regulator [Nonomuraea rosea]|uniref:PadR family transcriptional regulator n=1 Tax=Nonomuraea rosea TaxID=638574 RepID=UPI0031E564DF